MAIQTKLCGFLSNFRSVLTTRIAVQNAQPALFISAETKEKLKALPEKPKKPLSPFLRYSLDHRTEFVKKHPDAKVFEIAKMLGEEWKTVNADLKKKYEQRYKDELAAYTKENLEYLATLTEEQKRVLNEAAKEKKHAKETRRLHQFYKESNKPKRARSPYLCFIAERSNNIKGGLKEILHKGLWNKLSEVEKQKYVQMSEDDKKRYEMEMEVWEAKMIKEGHADMVRKSTLDDHKPKRPVHKKTSIKSTGK